MKIKFASIIVGAVAQLTTVVAVSCACSSESSLRLDGVWEMTSHLENGRELVEGARKLEPYRIVIKDNEIQSPLIFRSLGEMTTHRFTLLLNDTARPAQCDLVITAIEMNGARPIRVAVLRGVYAVSGKELKMCFAEEGERRPTGFEAQRGCSTFRFERIEAKP